MPIAKVFRTQYPVGHGGFHAGRIEVRDDGGYPTIMDKFYVYDCGSESPESFDRSLRNHCLMTGDRTDLLFVSHLDSDHMNKIDRLIGAAPAPIVVVPYLDLEDLSELLMREMDDGRVTASIRDYVSDPADWWRRRGAETVIFVEPGTGDDQPPDGGAPELADRS